MKTTTGKIKSNKGFYIGDLCYVLDDKKYDGIWGGAGFEDGVYKDPETGFSFAVAGTKYGDGTYHDDSGRSYGVDAGNLSLVPLELATRYTIEELERLGTIIYTSGEAEFTADEGVFDIKLPSGETIHINTDDEEDDEDGWDDEDWA